MTAMCFCEGYMANFNAVMMMGRLVSEPELKYVQSGLPVCRLRIVTNKKFKKADGSQGESSVFIDVTAWRRLAEICAQYLKKGREIFVYGELEQSNWADKETGQKRSMIRITADTIQFLGAPKNDADDDGAPEPVTPDGEEMPPE